LAVAASGAEVWARASGPVSALIVRKAKTKIHRDIFY
jgi:hypothetical protein